MNKQNGFLDEAASPSSAASLEDRYPELEKRRRFSKDYEVINELGQACWRRAKMERGNPAKQKELSNWQSSHFRKRWHWTRKT
ncbi:MAG: hypothetical protein U1F83_02715 [Verrucomicrobiota bacterium]